MTTGNDRRGISKGNFQLLDESQLKLIHQASLEILNDIGVVVKSSKALDILEGRGCRVKRAEERVFVSDTIVNKALDTAADKVILYARNPENNVVLDGSRMFVISGASALNVVDVEGNKRPPTMQDLYDFIRLHDSLRSVDIICPMVYPANLEAEKSETAMSGMVMKYSTKHCQFWAQDGRGVDSHFKMASAIYGNEKDAREKPLFGECIDLISPLLQPPDMVEALMRGAELGVPLYIETCAVMGATSPVTVAGTVAQSNANVLCGLVLAQLINPGTPCIYSTASGVMDMTSGNYSSAAPETNLVQVATAQLAHFYGLPCNAGCGIDAKIVDEQGAYERTFQNIACVLGGVDIIHQAVGSVEMMNAASYEQCVLDDEVFQAVSRFTRPVEITKETIGLDAIRRVNRGGQHYIMDDHTLKFVSKDFWKPNILDRNSYAVWDSGGRKSFKQRAKERVENILKNHFPEPVSSEVGREIDRIAGIDSRQYREN